MDTSLAPRNSGRFKSDYLHFYFPIAQLVEREAVNFDVTGSNPVRKVMPIEYEMKHLFDVTENAISKYSENHYAAEWYIGIEYIVLRDVLNNNETSLNEIFKPYELIAMRELIHRGLWLKWCDKTNQVVLSRDPIHKNLSDDTKPIPQGAD